MKKTDCISAVSMTALIIASFSVFFLFDDDFTGQLSAEDGFFETAGVVGLLIGSIFLFIRFFKENRGNELYFFRTRRNYLLLFTALVMFLAAGEEISWGQRILGIQPPEFFRSENVQSEINLHNLRAFDGLDVQGVKKTGIARLLTANSLFNGFWILLCVLIPISARVGRRPYNFLMKVNVPILPIWIGALFVVTYVSSKVLESGLGDEMKHYSVEIKECDYELLLGMAGLRMFLDWRHATSGARAEGSSIPT